MKFGITLLLAVTLCGGAFVPTANGDDKADRLLKNRARDLKTQAKRWWEKRKKLVGPCYHCKGIGRVSEIVAGQRYGGVSRKTCPTCEGRKRWVYSKVWNYLFLESMTPAFRARRGASRDTDSAYKRANAGDYPDRIRSYRIKDVALLNTTHGTVFVDPKGAAAELQSWIWVEGETRAKKGKWCLWDEKADGPWSQPTADPEVDPEDETPEAATRPEVEPGPKPSSAETAKRITKAVSTGDRPWHVHRVLEDTAEHALIVELKPSNTVDRSDYEIAVKASAVALTRAILALKAPRKVLWLRWMDEFRDQYGKVEWRSRLTTVMTLDAFQRVVWENLDADESFDLLDVEPQKHRGWKLWRR